jgi:hypothetical protein
VRLQSTSPVQEHVQHDLLSDNQYLYTKISRVIKPARTSESYQNRKRNIIVPPKSLEDIMPAIESQNGGRDTEKERDIRHRICQWL